MNNGFSEMNTGSRKANPSPEGSRADGAASPYIGSYDPYRTARGGQAQYARPQANASENGAGYHQPGAQTAVKTRPERTYTQPQSVLAVLSLVIGYLYIHMSLSIGSGIGPTVFFILLSVFALVFFKTSNVPVSKGQYAALGVLVLFSLQFALFDFSFVSNLNHLFLTVGFLYWAYTVSGARCNGRIDYMFFFEALRSVFEAPLVRLGRVFGAIGSGTNKRKGGRGVLVALLGLLIAIPLTAIITSLLSSADITFKQLVDRLFENIFDHIFTFILQAGLGIPVAMYLFGALYHAAENEHARLNGIPIRKSAPYKTSRPIPPSAIYFSIGPAIIVYIVFFAVQTGNLLNALISSQAPNGITPATYARTGFFDLCIAAAINALLIFIIETFQKRNNDSKSVLQRVYIVVMSVITILLVVTALAKMGMYVSYFGLTHARIRAAWFMVLLGLLFVAVIVKQFIKKLNFTKFAVVTFCVMFAVLAFGNVDRLISNVNVNMHLAGYTEKLDTAVIRRLNCGAVEDVIRYCEAQQGRDNMTAAEKREYYMAQGFLCKKAYMLGAIDDSRIEAIAKKLNDKLDSYYYDYFYDDFDPYIEDNPDDYQYDNSDDYWEDYDDDYWEDYYDTDLFLGILTELFGGGNTNKYVIRKTSVESVVASSALRSYYERTNYEAVIK